MDLTVDHLSVRIGSATLVSNVSMSVPSGTWTCLLGPNGAGKSTLLRAIAGLIGSAGHIHIGGNDPRTVRARRRARMIALVPQAPVMPGDMVVRDYILLGRTAFVPLFGNENKHDLEVTDELIGRLDLNAFAERPLATLSGGERQRAVMARALAQQAPVLLLDEPTTALDIGHQQEVLELVSTLVREHGLTVVAALHDITLAGQYGDRIALLRAGQLVADGRPSDVLTADRVSELYGADVKIIEVDGHPVVVPVRP